MRMKVSHGTVVAGKVELEDTTLEEGTRVAVVALDRGEALELTPLQRAELLASIREIAADETIDFDELVRELRA